VEARWRLGDKILAVLIAIQRRLLEAALHSVKAGGHLVYSTCSMEPEENGKVVRAALRSTEGFRLDAEHQIVSSREGGDGIYMARIIRKEAEVEPGCQS